MLQKNTIQESTLELLKELQKSKLLKVIKKEIVKAGFFIKKL